VTLPSLAVLDLSGTPLATTEGYRLLVLFRLPRLKVLDGTPAGAAEVATAHAQHAGRLTLSQLVRQGEMGT
jgi:ABC-type proline/glycine betaine transport system permease subunit